MKNIMVVSPHPDDETLGAGGSILKLKNIRNKVFWLNVTDVKEGCEWDDVFVKKRKGQIEKIREFYGFQDFINLQFPPTQLNDCMQRELIDAIGWAFDKIRPECIILPDYNDAHSDHKYVFDACYSCSKIFRREFIKRILTMEIPSETNLGKPYNGFNPNLYIDITDYLKEKMEAMNIYDTEFRTHPFPRSLESIKAQAVLRGAEAGVTYAEAFRVIKEIE